MRSKASSQGFTRPFRCCLDSGVLLAGWIALWASNRRADCDEADETQANSALVMRDIRKLLQLPSLQAASFHNRCTYLWDQRMRHKTTTKSSAFRQSIRHTAAQRKADKFTGNPIQPPEIRNWHKTQPGAFFSVYTFHRLQGGLEARGLGNSLKKTRFSSQARVRLQRVHLGVPAVVVDGVSFCHPQHWTLAENKRKDRQSVTEGLRPPALRNVGQRHWLDPSALRLTLNKWLPRKIQFQKPVEACEKQSNQQSIFSSHYKGCKISTRENGLYFNYFCSVIPIKPACNTIKRSAHYLTFRPDQNTKSILFPQINLH